MKIYTGYPGGITKITNDKGFYQTEDLANVISVYVNQADVTGITYTLALEFLRADGRKTTIYTEDSFASGEATTLTEENVTYDIHNFTLTNTQLAVAGALAFTCYINILNSGVVEKRGVLFNAVSNVRKTVTYSANTIFVVSEDDEDVPTIVADMKTAIETLSNQLAGKVNTADIADDLTTNNSDKVLSAKQGYILNAMLDALEAATYTKSEVDSALALKADVSTVSGINARVGSIETEVGKLESVQNVVDVVATKSALNSYDTSKLEENDKIQVIADESQGGASTIYNWNGSAWQYVGAYGTNSYTKQETLEQIDLHKLVNKTYSELATLKSNNGLVAGQMYRIIDYVTTTNGKCNGIDNDVRSVEHPFDVIVTAISVNEFSENARAIQHTGDSYFANSKLEAWRLWYSFDNDTTRFEWADTTNGKGIIYRMIDEFQNDVPYDFKNIQFKRYKITGLTDSRQNRMLDKYLGFNGNYNVTSDSSDFVWRFTFSKRVDNSDLSLIEVNNSTFNSNAYVKQVVIGEYITDTPTYRCKQALNNIVMEVEALIVDVEMGKGSHHNTWIGNEDIDYCYFSSMFRNNILFGEINHTRADECFEQNVIGEGSYTLYASCWNKFSHHFSRNIGINMQSNDFEGQVAGTKFPEHFTRNHISNMWNNVDASTHDTFNGCSFNYAVECTFGGVGTWDGVVVGKLYHVSISINILFGSTISRMEYVTIHQQQNTYNIVNLYIGSLFGASTKTLTIDLTDLYNYQLTTAYVKKIDYAWNEVLNARSLFYSVAIYDTGTQMIYNNYLLGIINSTDYSVTWSETKSVPTKIQETYDGLFNTKMAKLNPTGTGSISMNDGNASGTNSYANGSGATASGNFSEARGFGATASGNYSTSVHGTASGSNSIAYGNSANASGNSSIAFGDQCKAKGDNQVVTGKFNIPDTSSLEIVGNGAYMNTDNARLLDANGNEYLKGDLYINTTFTKDSNGDLLTKRGMSVKQEIANLKTAVEGNLYNETTDSGIAYEVALSNPLPYGKIDKAGGMSYKGDSQLDISLLEDNYGLGSAGLPETFYNRCISDFISVVPNTTYNLIWSYGNHEVRAIYCFYGNDKSFITRSSNLTTPTTISTSSTTYYIRVCFYTYESGTTDLYDSKNELTSLYFGVPNPTHNFYGIRNTAVSQLIIKGANLLQLNDVAETTTNGITYSVQNGVITLNGTANANGLLNPFYLANNVYINGNFTLKWFSGLSDNQNIGVDVYFNGTALNVTDSEVLSRSYDNVTLSSIRFYIASGLTFNNYRLKPMLVNGSTAPSEYKPYVTPIIKPIPSEIQALTGWGWGISESVCNYIDYDNKKFIQMVGRAKISDLSWTFDTSTYRANVVANDIQVATTRTLELLLSGYDSIYNGEGYNASWDKVIYSTYPNTIYVTNKSYSSLEQFLTNEGDKYIYYPLQTPIETDVSQYLTDENYDVLPNLEPNGSIVLDNTYQQEAVYDITTLEKVSV